MPDPGMVPAARTAHPDETASPGATGDGPRPVEAPDRQAFWTLIVGTPVVLSVLRLWVEAGGEPQTMLLLVANVDPVNLVAALFVTAAWLASTALVAVFAIGGILRAGNPAGAEDATSRWLFARWRAAAPPWLTIGSFLLAALTLEILFLPLLALAACAAFQVSPWHTPHRWLRVGAFAVMIGLYTVLLWPTLTAAWAQGEMFPVLLLTAPVVLAVFIAGPVAGWLVGPVGVLAHVAVPAMMVWAAYPFVTTPVLPLNVVVTGAVGEPATYLRGYVISVDDVHTVMLRERGGVEYVPNADIRSQMLCPTDQDIPRYRLWVGDIHVEDSVLRGIGRQVRPIARERPECRVESSSS